jgi:antitoxin YefM
MTISEVMTMRSLASVKAQFSAVVDSVHDTRERVVVTRNGEPVVAVVAVDDLESLDETLAALQNENVMRDLAQAEREVADGDTLSADELRFLVARGAQAGA